MKPNPNHQNLLPNPELKCTCVNPQVGALNYKGIINGTELYQNSWQDEVEAYKFYINRFNLKNSLFEIDTLEVTNHVEWFKSCPECSKSLVHKIEGENKA